eukprot:gnl/Chilomastix_cuspidata/4617.p1 GENE.gnl/Chilomastix_cuspidata/4617~~gnl/Chilomastix_cuspidata/4617.p1  ORF type:complete len:1381 (+),score=53.05 gnl/Chilomastix_cuspidata/4617:56-4198(+)
MNLAQFFGYAPSQPDAGRVIPRSGDHIARKSLESMLTPILDKIYEELFDLLQRAADPLLHNEKENDEEEKKESSEGASDTIQDLTTKKLERFVEAHLGPFVYSNVLRLARFLALFNYLRNHHNAFTFLTVNNEPFQTKTEKLDRFYTNVAYEKQFDIEQFPADPQRAVREALKVLASGESTNIPKTVACYNWEGNDMPVMLLRTSKEWASAFLAVSAPLPYELRARLRIDKTSGILHIICDDFYMSLFPRRSQSENVLVPYWNYLYFTFTSKRVTQSLIACGRKSESIKEEVRFVVTVALEEARGAHALTAALFAASLVLARITTTAVSRAVRSTMENTRARMNLPKIRFVPRTEPELKALGYIAAVSAALRAHVKPSENAIQELSKMLRIRWGNNIDSLTTVNVVLDPDNTATSLSFSVSPFRPFDVLTYVNGKLVVVLTGPYTRETLFTAFKCAARESENYKLREFGLQLRTNLGPEYPSMKLINADSVQGITHSRLLLPLIGSISFVWNSCNISSDSLPQLESTAFPIQCSDFTNSNLIEQLSISGSTIANTIGKIRTQLAFFLLLREWIDKRNGSISHGIPGIRSTHIIDLQKYPDVTNAIVQSKPIESIEMFQNAFYLSWEGCELIVNMDNLWFCFPTPDTCPLTHFQSDTMYLVRPEDTSFASYLSACMERILAIPLCDDASLITTLVEESNAFFNVINKICSSTVTRLAEYFLSSDILNELSGSFARRVDWFAKLIQQDKNTFNIKLDTTNGPLFLCFEPVSMVPSILARILFSFPEHVISSEFHRQLALIDAIEDLNVFKILPYGFPFKIQFTFCLKTLTNTARIPLIVRVKKDCIELFDLSKNGGYEKRLHSAFCFKELREITLLPNLDSNIGTTRLERALRIFSQTAFFEDTISNILARNVQGIYQTASSRPPVVFALEPKNELQLQWEFRLLGVTCPTPKADGETDHRYISAEAGDSTNNIFDTMKVFHYGLYVHMPIGLREVASTFRFPSFGLTISLVVSSTASSQVWISPPSWNHIPHDYRTHPIHHYFQEANFWGNVQKDTPIIQRGTNEYFLSSVGPLFENHFSQLLVEAGNHMNTNVQIGRNVVVLPPIRELFEVSIEFLRAAFVAFVGLPFVFACAGRGITSRPPVKQRLISSEPIAVVWFDMLLTRCSLVKTKFAFAPKCEIIFLGQQGTSMQPPATFYHSSGSDLLSPYFGQFNLIFLPPSIRNTFFQIPQTKEKIRRWTETFIRCIILDGQSLFHVRWFDAQQSALFFDFGFPALRVPVVGFERFGAREVKIRIEVVATARTYNLLVLKQEQRFMDIEEQAIFPTEKAKELAIQKTLGMIFAWLDRKIIAMHDKREEIPLMRYFTLLIACVEQFLDASPT